MQNSKVHCVIVAFNAARWVENCLRSLRGSSIPLHVIIIDNGSTDGTQQIIKQNYLEVEFIQAERNLGFGKANNIGIRKGYDHGAEYIFLLNQDAWIQTDTIREMVEAAERNPQFGVLSPMHLNGSGVSLDYNFSRYIAPSNCRGLYSDIFLKNVKKEPYELAFVNAAAWLMTRRCVETVGGFSASFFHYSEDDNYCQRVLFHGFKVGIVADARIFHDRENSPRSTHFIEHEKIIRRNMAFRYSNPNLNWSVFKMFFDAMRELIRAIAAFVFQPQKEKFKGIGSRIKVISRTPFKKLKRNNDLSRKPGMSFLED